MERRYRIFISSPSDVRPERAIAERVVAKLARELGHLCAVEAVMWEREPLLASGHFQDIGNIPASSSTDICVVVLWSRLGVPLPEAEFRGPLSGRPVTGTEWEFEDALRGYRERQLPDLLVYRKTAEIVASLSDDAALDEIRSQKRQLNAFLERWFRSADGASFTAASHNFATTAEFEDRLEEHLRALLRRRLEHDLDLHAEARAITWTEAPWPALASFDIAQAPIFYGRTRARNELRELLAAEVEANKAFVLVIGASGSGKSSLVKAGLLPDLMLPGMVGDVGLVRYGIMRPTEGGGDTVRALAEAMHSETALPELTELQYSAETLAAQLRQAPAQVAFTVRQGLARAAAGKLTALGQARLVVVIDQLEELFTGDAITQAERETFVDILSALARSGLVWLIATLRADFFDRLEQLPALAELSKDARYLLLPPSLSEIGEIVRRPARAAGLRFEVSETTGQGLDDVIVNAAAHDPGALPLLSFALDRLWRQPREGTTLTFAAYADLGELEGAIAHHAEAVVGTLPAASQAVLPGLLRSLVVLREAEQQATARTCRIEELSRTGEAALVVDRLIAARLLIADETPQGVTVRFAHEALLHRWPRLAAAIDDGREALAAMARLRTELLIWTRHGRPHDLLLPPGKRLSEGLDLVERRRDELSPELIDFIQVSEGVANAAARRRRHLVTAAFAVLSLLVVIAGIGAWLGYAGQRAFERQFLIAEAARARNLALALSGEADRKIVEAVSLEIVPGGDGDAARARMPELVDRLVTAANDDRERLVIPQDNIVRMAAYSPDGTRIATGSFDHTARIWDAATGRLLLTLAGHTDRVESVAFSPDGRRIVTASKDGTARIWDAATGSLTVTLSGHRGTVVTARFSPDGRRIVTASQDATSRIWDATGGTVLVTLTGHSDGVNSAEFSPDGKRIVSASDDHSAKVWDAETGSVIATLTGHESFVNSAVFSPDGSRILTASNDQMLRLWNASTGAPIDTLRGHEAIVYSAVFSPDGRMIASASQDKSLRLWDAADGRLMATITGHEGSVVDVRFAPDGRRIVTTSLDKTARVWDVAAGGLLLTLSGQKGRPQSASFSPDGRRVAVPSDDHSVDLYDAGTGEVQATLVGHQRSVYSAAFSPDGKRIVTASDDKTIRLWDAVTGAQIRVLTGHDSYVVGASFSPDGRSIISASADRTARLWDAEGAAPPRIFAGHEDLVNSARFSPDGKRIVTASRDRTVRLWDVASGGLIRTLSGHGAAVEDAEFSPDGKRIVSASQDKTARLWDADSGTMLGILTGHDASVKTAMFSPDGRRVVTGSLDRTVRVWDAATGGALAVVVTADKSVSSAAFSPDGRRIVVASLDRSTRIWDAPDYLDASRLGFVRAIASREVDAPLRTLYALPTPPPALSADNQERCKGASEAAVPDGVVLESWRKDAMAGDGGCNALLASRLEAAPGGMDEAFFRHALAARLLTERGLEGPAQTERFRREALAWQLPQDRVSRLMSLVAAWRPGDPVAPP